MSLLATVEVVRRAIYIIAVALLVAACAASPAAPEAPAASTVSPAPGLRAGCAAVTDGSTARGLVGVWIIARSAGHTEQITTRGDGTYCLSLPHGEYVFELEAPDVRVVTRWVVDARRAGPPFVSLPSGLDDARVSRRPLAGRDSHEAPTGARCGRVRQEPGGAGLASVTVTAQSERHHSVAVTNEDGWYCMRRLVAGDYEFLFSIPNYTVRKRVSIVPGKRGAPGTTFRWDAPDRHPYPWLIQ